MRFIDEAIIEIRGGNGGPGCVSFRREKFAPRGGPDGGDGGAGGSVTFVATAQLSTLQDFRFRRTYQGGHGNHGEGGQCAGRDGESILVRIPVGTLLRDAETLEILFDFEKEGDQWVVCEGGRGGKGNSHFVSSTFQAPKFAQPGEEGEVKKLKLELKLLADVAIVGFPNAGKSTLISRLSAARPKIADYAFTTLTPNLGVVALSDHRSFVVADIPGLIEGAHRGLGLGHKFLKHIERTRLLVHLMDLTPFVDKITMPESIWETDPKALLDQTIQQYKTIREELRLFNPELLHKPEICVFNKADLISSYPELKTHLSKALRAELRSLRETDPVIGEPYFISGVSGEGIRELQEVLSAKLTDLLPKLNHNLVLPDDPSIRRQS